eukprot:s44_g32.t2
MQCDVSQEMIAGVARLSGPASSLNMAQLLFEGEVLRREVEGLSQNVYHQLQDAGVKVTVPISAETQKTRDNSKNTKRSTSSIMQVKRRSAASRCWQKISKWALSLTESFQFQLTFALLICSLCAVMGFEVQYRGFETGFKLGYTGYTQSAAEIWPLADPAFEIIDIFFGAAFTLELLLKLVASGCTFFKDVWNWLDSLVLIVWYLERMTAAAFPLDPMMLRLFRLSRLMRMVRLVKIFEQCDALYLMLTSIRASFAALAWSSALIQMMLALAMVTLVEPYLSGPNSTGDKYAVYSYYGTFTRAMLTLFDITLGNFVPVTRLMMQDVSEVYVIFALIHKLVIGFAVVMVITGVFVQETMTAQCRIRKTALFKAADFDGSGRLDKGEWLQVCDDYSVQLWLAAMGLDVSNAALVHELICAKNNKEDQTTAGRSHHPCLFDIPATLLTASQDDLNAKDLVSGIARLKGSARNIDMALFRKEFLHTAKVVKDMQEKVQMLKELPSESYSRKKLCPLGRRVALLEVRSCHPFTTGGVDQVHHMRRRLPKELALPLLPGAFLLCLLQPMEAADGEEDDESGWKLLYGDVMRPPRGAFLLASCVAIGAGQWASMLGFPELSSTMGAFSLGRLHGFLELPRWSLILGLPLLQLPDLPLSCLDPGRSWAAAAACYWEHRDPSCSPPASFKDFIRFPGRSQWMMHVGHPAAKVLDADAACSATSSFPRRFAGQFQATDIASLLLSENHRWYWSSFTVATAGAFFYLSPVMIRSDDMTFTLLPLLQGCLLAGSTAFLVALRMVLFAYSQSRTSPSRGIAPNPAANARNDVKVGLNRRDRRESWHSRNSMVEGQLQKEAPRRPSTQDGVISNSNESLSLASLLCKLGIALHALHSFNCQQAVQELASLPKRHYETSYVLDLVGLSYFESADYKKSETAYNQAWRIEPYRVEGLEYYSSALWHLRRDVELCRLAQQCLQWDRLKPQVWCVVGNCFSLQKEHDAAIKLFKRAIQVDSTFTYAYTLCGHEFVACEKIDKAVAMYENALNLDPRHYNAWWGLGNIYLRQEEHENAKYHFYKAGEMELNVAIVALSLAWTSSISEIIASAKQALQVDFLRLLFADGRCLDLLDQQTLLHEARIQNGDVLNAAVLPPPFLAAANSSFVLSFAVSSVVAWGNDDLRGTRQWKDVQHIQASESAYVAILTDGSVAMCGGLPYCETPMPNQLTNVQYIQATQHAFAAICSDGTVASWGHKRFGGDSSIVQQKLVQVQAIQASDRAFAAICHGGTVVTWGDPHWGGDSRHVQQKLRDVQHIQATRCAFAAILSGGTVVSWGARDYGGDSSNVQEQLQRVQKIQASDHAFAALLLDQTVVTWGDPNCGGDSSLVQNQLKNVQQIQSSEHAFAAILADGHVVTWGHPEFGGDSSQVQDQLTHVKHIQSTESAFAAIRKDGRVVTWGNKTSGADSSKVQDQLTNVQHIQATHHAFAAIRSNGTVASWGHPRFGGDSSMVQHLLKDVRQIQASQGAFAAAGRKLVAWGNSHLGGTNQEVNASNSVLRCYLGMVLSSLKQPLLALESFDQAAQAEPQNGMAYFQKACVLMSLERFDEALSDLKKVRCLAPKEACVHFQLGKVYMKLQKDRKALFHFNIAMDLNRDSKDYHTIKMHIEKLHIRGISEEPTGEVTGSRMLSAGPGAVVVSSAISSPTPLYGQSSSPASASREPQATPVRGLAGGFWSGGSSGPSERRALPYPVQRRNSPLSWGGPGFRI